MTVAGMYATLAHPSAALRVDERPSKEPANLAPSLVAPSITYPHYRYLVLAIGTIAFAERPATVTV
jgi:hypothetical protein